MRAAHLRQGILFKAPKPGQDRRADLPTIGPRTAQGTVAAGLDGIVIEAGGVIVIDRPKVVESSTDAGLFLWVRAP
jgi:UDP-2,3-diacylglucosamine hydrolase